MAGRPNRNLSERDKELYRIIVRAAKAAAPTPRHKDLAAALTEAGYPIDTCEVGPRIDKLLKARFIERMGDGHGSRIVYRIIGTKHSTTERGSEWKAADWPRPSLTSAEAYDAAVAARLFARHETRATPQPVRAVRAPYGNRSLSGCAAAMVAA